MKTGHATNLKSFRACLTALPMFSLGALLVLGASIFLENPRFIVSAVRQQARLIHRIPVEEGEPIVITNVKVNGKEISLDDEFTAADDWMKSLVITVKNRSDKRILFVSLGLRFPRPPGSQEKISISDMPYGNEELLARAPTQQERSAGFSPGQSVDIQLNPKTFEDLKNFLSATGYPLSIDTLDVKISQVIFMDDTMWAGGRVRRRDSKDPSSWTFAKPDPRPKVYLASMSKRRAERMMNVRPPTTNQQNWLASVSFVSASDTVFACKQSSRITCLLVS